MLNDLFKTLRSALAERLTNPFLRSFCISWVIVNWRLWAILLFDSSPMADRLKLIDDQELSESLNFSLHLYPAIAAAIFVAVMPWFELWLDKLRAIPIKRRKTQRQDFEKFSIEIKKSLADDREGLDEKEAGFNRRERLITERERALDEREAQLPSESESLQNEARLEEAQNLNTGFQRDIEILVLRPHFAAITAELRRISVRAFWLNPTESCKFSDYAMRESIHSSKHRAEEMLKQSMETLTGLQNDFSKFEILAPTFEQLSDRIGQFAKIIDRVNSLDVVQLNRAQLEASLRSIGLMFFQISTSIENRVRRLEELRNRGSEILDSFELTDTN